MIETGRGLWGSSGPILHLRWGHLELIAQDYIHMFFEYLQGGRLHSLPWQPVPMLSHPHGKKVLPDVQMGPPVFQVMLIASGPLASSTPLKRAWLHPFFAVSIWVFVHITDISP